MVLLKLLGYAVGSVMMYWGVLLLLTAPWILAVIVIILVNKAWNKVTGQNGEWRWFVDWFDTAIKAIHRLKFEWIGWIPGILIQIWYAGYVANLVHSSLIEASPIAAIALYSMGVVGMVVAAIIFYWLYSRVVEVKLGRWIYLWVGGVSLSAYFVLLQQPQTAAALSEIWQRVFAALLTESI